MTEPEIERITPTLSPARVRKEMTILNIIGGPNVFSGNRTARPVSLSVFEGRCCSSTPPGWQHWQGIRTLECRPPRGRPAILARANDKPICDAKDKLCARARVLWRNLCGVIVLFFGLGSGFVAMFDFFSSIHVFGRRFGWISWAHRFWWACEFFALFEITERVWFFMVFI